MSFIQMEDILTIWLIFINYNVFWFSSCASLTMLPEPEKSMKNVEKLEDIWMVWFLWSASIYAFSSLGA